MKTKTTASDVAKYILSVQGSMTAMKLEKLVYYAQVWALVWDEEPLFNEKIEAWANGPVVPELYYMHKGLFKVSLGDICGKITNLSANNKDTINKVLKGYGKFSAQQLIDLTHSESPWQNARGNTPAGEPCKNEICIDAIAEYYSSKLATS
jgi:uncharacterized phage-associated protein|nr:MAG TPA: hypothetical protein [Caudoviricetes sp.]